jgi:transposase
LKPILCAGFIFPDMAFSVAALVRKRGFLVMAGLRRAIELAIGEEDLAALRAIARSRTEPARRVERARMVLAYREDPSFFAVGRALGVHHQTVERCVERALAYGPMAALDDRARPGKEPTITAEAKAWLVSLACRKAKDLGYPHELWTTRLLARHAREHGPAEGQASLGKLAQGTLCKILNEQEVKATQGPHLPGAPRAGVQAEDGGGSVRLSRSENPEGKRGPIEDGAERRSGDRLL